MIEWPILASIAAVCVALLTVIGFWSRFSDRLTKAESTARSAEKTAENNRDSITTINAAFGLYREQVASEYIHRETMREVENRMTAAIDRLGDRFDKFLQQALKLGRDE